MDARLQRIRLTLTQLTTRIFAIPRARKSDAFRAWTRLRIDSANFVNFARHPSHRTRARGEERT